MSRMARHSEDERASFLAVDSSLDGSEESRRNTRQSPQKTKHTSKSGWRCCLKWTGGGLLSLFIVSGVAALSGFLVYRYMEKKVQELQAGGVGGQPASTGGALYAGNDVDMDKLKAGSYVDGDNIWYLAGFAPSETWKDSYVKPIEGNAKHHKEGQNPDGGLALQNLVRKCKCTKPNAFTMKTCNACGEDISNVEKSTTVNTISGFCLGYEKNNFGPAKMSIRKQNEDYLVFDDVQIVLSLSPAHLLAVPCQSHISDVRELFNHAAEGRVLVQALRDQAKEATKESFVTNAAFKSRWWKNVDNFAALEQDAEKFTETLFNGYTAMGFNYPPSQWQLHLQVMIAPFFPLEQKQLEQDNHFHIGRFLPYDYVMEGLRLVAECTDQAKKDALLASLKEGEIYNEKTRELEGLLKSLKVHFGLDYLLTYREAAKKKFLEKSRALQAFKHGSIKDGGDFHVVARALKSGKTQPTADSVQEWPADMQAADKKQYSYLGKGEDKFFYQHPKDVDAFVNGGNWHEIYGKVAPPPVVN